MINGSERNFLFINKYSSQNQEQWKQHKCSCLSLYSLWQLGTRMVYYDLAISLDLEYFRLHTTTKRCDRRAKLAETGLCRLV